ncbi:MAG: sigma-70 family RNA polymerase sigma factor [Candidatus Liptonbacteria bacterium]|nr:sigma-70 family RNA polymerase sigma factor [Candidatus Liptonbacteria bacterium]
MLDGENSIIKKAIQGEASAFGLLYDFYQPKIYRFVLIKVGRREEAEDLTHQVFLSAWQNVSHYKDLGFPFSSWLYRIAKNQVVDYYRTSKATMAIEEVDPNYFAVPASAQFGLDDSLRLEQVRLAIQTLDQDYQDVVVMRFVEDLSIKETAAAIGKSEGAVKLIQHRAIKKLKEGLIK